MKGRWHGEPFLDYKNRKWLITLELDKPPVVYDSTRDKPLNIEITEHRNKRSINANNYFYKLIGLIAEASGANTTEVHDRLLSDNLCFVIEDGAVDWTVKDWEANEYRLYRYKDDYWLDSLQEVKMQKPDGEYYMKDGKVKTSKIFWHIKGSHQMDTKEMSKLIDDTVREAKNLGIETLTPKELERMKQAWKQ